MKININPNGVELCRHLVERTVGQPHILIKLTTFSSCFIFPSRYLGKEQLMSIGKLTSALISAPFITSPQGKVHPSVDGFLTLEYS